MIAVPFSAVPFDSGDIAWVAASTALIIKCALDGYSFMRSARSNAYGYYGDVDVMGEPSKCGTALTEIGKENWRKLV